MMVTELWKEVSSSYSNIDVNNDDSNIQSDNINVDQEFVVVRRQRKDRRRQGSNLGGKYKPSQQCTFDEVPIEKINTIMESACSSIEMINYSKKIICLLHEILGGHELTTVWALGLGHFGRLYHPGCDQLALLLKLKEFFDCEVYFQEPCLTGEEKQWLRERNIFISESNDLFTCRIHNEADHVLFYAPHCGHAIYNSVIYAHRKYLKNIVIIGNNFGTMDLSSYPARGYPGISPENSGQDTMAENSTAASAMLDFNEIEALLAYSERCTIIEFPIFKINFAAFNDTALHFVSQTASLPIISDRKPEYRKFKHEIVF